MKNDDTKNNYNNKIGRDTNNLSCRTENGRSAVADLLISAAPLGAHRTRMVLRSTHWDGLSSAPFALAARFGRGSVSFARSTGKLGLWRMHGSSLVHDEFDAHRIVGSGTRPSPSQTKTPDEHPSSMARVVLKS